jgi:acetyl-CoA C-acetyltransferase
MRVSPGRASAIRACLRGEGLVALDDIEVAHRQAGLLQRQLARRHRADAHQPRIAKVNPNGSGISLGHTVGSTGVIITTKAIHELHRTGGRHALVTTCIGGGQGIAAIFERS